MPESPYTLDPGVLPDMITAPEFRELPFDQRQKVLEYNLQGAVNHVQQNGGWTPESWRDFGELSNGLRQRITDSETFGEKAAYVGRTLTKGIGDTLAIGTVSALGASPVLPTGETQVPMQTTGPALGLNVMRGVEAVRQNFNSAKRAPLEAALGELKTQIDQGDFLQNPQAFLDKRAAALNDLQGEWYGEATPDAGTWREQNHLLGNAENAALLGSYMRTRDPAIWKQLSENLYKTPQQARNEFQQGQLQTTTALGRALKPDAQPLISEAADPMEMAGAFYAMIKGAKALQRGAKASERVKDVAKGVAGEMLGEQGSLTLDQPLADLQTRQQVAKDTLIVALGLGGLGAAGQALQNAGQPLSPNDTLTPNPPPQAGAPAGTGTPTGAAPLGAVAGTAPVSPLPGIAARAGTVDALIPSEIQDTGPMTEEEARGLETGRQDQVPSSTFQVPSSQTLPATANPEIPQTITGSNVQTGTEMPVPPETKVEAGGESLLQGIQTREVPLDTLSLSRDVPQFKSDANEQGVVEPLAGRYERLGTGPILIWERLDGRREVISGRHRFDLAKRTGEKTIPAQVMREADGFTLPMAITADAELNIRDGHGKTKDFANYFRHAGLSDTEAEARGLRARAPGRAGWTIGTQASPAVFDLHANGQLTDAQAEALARTAPGNEALQRAGVVALNRGTPIDVTVNLLKAMQSEIGAAPTPDQMDLFGADDSAMLRMEEQARKATEIQRGLKEQVAAVQGAAKRPEQARKLGVNVKDPSAVQRKVDALKAELYRWESWPLHEDLRAQVKGVGQPMSDPFALQQPTAEEMRQEQAAAEQRAALAARQSRPLTGTAGEYGTPDLLDTTAGDMALFSQPGGSAEPLPAAPPKSFSKLASAPTLEGVQKHIAKYYGGEAKTLVPLGGGRYQVISGSGKVLSTSVLQTRKGFYFGTDSLPSGMQASRSFPGSTAVAAQAAAVAGGQQAPATVPGALFRPGDNQTRRPGDNQRGSAASVFFQPGGQRSGVAEVGTAGAAPSLEAAYTAASQGQSTAFLPLAAVWQQAQAQNPQLDPGAFVDEIMRQYEAGTVLLEGANSQQEADAAGLTIQGTPVGTAVRMMLAPQESGMQASRGWNPERFERVIPRDLFNEAKMLAMVSKFAQDVAAGKMPQGFAGKLSNKWTVALSEGGELYVSGLDLTYQGMPARLTSNYNAGKEVRFPLQITVEDADLWGVTVYDQQGNVDSDMAQFEQPAGVGKIEIPDWTATIEELKRLGRIGLDDNSGLEPKNGQRGFADSFRNGRIQNIEQRSGVQQANSEPGTANGELSAGIPGDSPSQLFYHEPQDLQTLDAQEMDALRAVQKDYPGAGAVSVLDLANQPGLSVHRTRATAAHLQSWSGAFRDLFGKRVLFVNAPAEFNGGNPTANRNILVVNVNSREPLAYIVGHELWHAIRAQRPDLSAALEQEILASGTNLDAYRARLRRMGYPESEIDQEIMADFVGAQMLEPDFLNRLATTKPKLFQRFAKALLDFTRQLIGRLAKLNRDVRPFFQNRLEDFRDQLATALKTYAEEGRFPANPIQGSAMQPSYAGEKAEMPQFMRDSLETAKAMAAAGKSSEEIRAVTGWFPGKYDGKMRWEVPDEDARYLPAAKDWTRGNDQWAATLEEVMDHPKLFQAYPELRKVRVSRLATSDGTRGKYVKAENRIYLNALNDRLDNFSTLLHEIQHWIQDKEGFAKGGNPNAMNQIARELAEELRSTGRPSIAFNAMEEARAADYATMIKRWRRNPESLTKSGVWSAVKTMTPPLKRSKDRDEYMRAAVDRAEKYLLKDLENWQYPKLYEALKLPLDELNRISRNAWGRWKRNSKARAAFERLREIEYNKDPDKAIQFYRLLAGEIESRDVQARQSYTPEQRRAIAPYSSENIAPEDAIVMFGGSSMQASVSEGPNETQARFASPDAAKREINGPRSDAQVAAEAQAWLDSVDTQTAVEMFAAKAVPLALDAQQQAIGRLIVTLAKQAEQGGTEVQRTWAHVNNLRLTKIYTSEFLSADAARSQRQRGVVANDILAPMKPILTAQGLLTDRAEERIKKRFTGGTEGVTEKVKAIVTKADTEAGTDLAGELDKETRRRGDGETGKRHPNLKRLLDTLRKKMFPGMTWADIFMDLPDTQKARQIEIYKRLMKDERLQGLNQAERLALTNELDRAWMKGRRKVFMRELEKAGVLGEKKDKDREKVKAVAPKLLRLMNLGMLNSAMFRETLAAQYGVKQIDAQTGAELRALGERIQQAPEGLPRRKLETQLLERLQQLTDSTIWQIIDSWWTASVLSGPRTSVDILLSVANGIEDVGLGSLTTALRTGNKDVALRGLGALFGRLPSAVAEAWDHVTTGNKALMRNFELEAKQALEGGNRLASDVGAELWRKGGLRKIPGGFMMFYGRLFTALDHINSASTAEGAKMMALARHPELYQRALRTTPADRAAAQKQARIEMLGFDRAPTTPQERLEVQARTREILDQATPVEMLDEAREVGRRAALQGDPTGLGKVFLDAVTALAGTISRHADEMTQRQEQDAITRRVAVIVGALSPLSRALTGTKFARSVAHAINRTTSYFPGIGILTVGQQGRTGAFGDILAARQVLGTLACVALYLAYADDEDDERGIEDGWKDKTPQEKAQLYAQGKQPFTVWERDAQGRVHSYNYQQWGIAGIMNTTAYLLKHQDSAEGRVQVLATALTQGVLSVSDKAQLQGLQTVFGDNYRSTDANGELASRLNKYVAQTVGGVVPRIFKDIDMMASPELRSSSEWWQKWTKEVPMLREHSSGKRVDIFGEDIKLDRGPLSRVMQIGTADPDYRLLARLNEKDLWLPDPTQGVRVVKLADGTRRNMTDAEKDRYQRLTGQAYRQFIRENGNTLLQMQPDDAKDWISKTTKYLRDTAAYQAVH